MERESFAPDCNHQCTSNCRREGCNCLCGEWHGTYEEETQPDLAHDEALADAEGRNQPL